MSITKDGAPRESGGPKSAGGSVPRLLSSYGDLIGAFPFLFFALESVLAVISSLVYEDSDWLLKMMFAQLLAVNMMLAGMLHFVPQLYPFYRSMIFLPFPKFWLYSSGVAMTVGGLCVAFVKTQVIGAWLLIGVLVIVFPGNVACVVSPYPRYHVCGGSLLGAVLRLPFQFFFIAWAYWFTTPPHEISF